MMVTFLMMFLMLFGVFRLLGFFLESCFFGLIVKLGFLVSVLDEDLFVFLKIDHDLLFDF